MLGNSERHSEHLDGKAFGTKKLYMLVLSMLPFSFGWLSERMMVELALVAEHDLFCGTNPAKLWWD